jgi:hypothetical protein
LTPPHNQPKVFFPVGVTGEFAATICDLQSIRDDLNFAQYMAATTLANLADLEALGPTPDDPEQSAQRSAVVRALWSATLISYRRAFATGKSHAVPAASRFNIQGLREELLTPEQKHTDQELRDYIDKHVAHRALDLEQVKVLVFLNPPPNPRGIIGLSPATLFGFAPSKDLVNLLSEICDVLISAIEPQISRMTDNLQKALEREHLDAMYTKWAEENPITIR